MGVCGQGEDGRVPQNERKMIHQGCAEGSMEHLPLILLYELFLLSPTLWHSWRGGRGGRKSHRVIFQLCLINSIVWIDSVTEGLKDNLGLVGSRCSHSQPLWTSGTMWVLGEQLGLGSALCPTLCQGHIGPCWGILGSLTPPHSPTNDIPCSHSSSFPGTSTSALCEIYTPLPPCRHFPVCLRHVPTLFSCLWEGEKHSGDKAAAHSRQPGPAARPELQGAPGCKAASLEVPDT